jgi:hypothetical protein
MHFTLSLGLLTLPLAQVIATPLVSRDGPPKPPAAPAVNVTTCNGKKYTYEGLAGFGKLPSDARDKFGDTIGLGSAMALDKASCKKSKDKKGAYSGIIWGLPDRGWYVLLPHRVW